MLYVDTERQQSRQSESDATQRGAHALGAHAMDPRTSEHPELTLVPAAQTPPSSVLVCDELSRLLPQHRDEFHELLELLRVLVREPGERRHRRLRVPKHRRDGRCASA